MGFILQTCLFLSTSIIAELILRFKAQEWTIIRNSKNRPQSARFRSFDFIKIVEPHKNSEYLSEDFWTEMQLLNKHGSAEKRVNDYGQRYDVAKNCTGIYFTVNNNLRTTVDEPQNPTGKIFLFGSSTLHNFEVPDYLTTASILQKIKNESGETIKVKNYGVSGATVESNFARIRSMNDEFKSGDTVILLFGVNDVGVDTYAKNESIPLKVFRRLGEFSLLIRQLHRLIARRSWRTHAIETARHKILLITEIKDYFSLKNIKFIPVLEPILHQKQRPNQYEQALRKSFGQKLEHLYGFGYREFTKQQKSNSIQSLIHIFDQTSESVFLDQAHINATGTKILAIELNKICAL